LNRPPFESSNCHIETAHYRLTLPPMYVTLEFGEFQKFKKPVGAYRESFKGK